MPVSPFADGTGFCSVCLYRTRLWVPADDEHPATRQRRHVAQSAQAGDVDEAQMYLISQHGGHRFGAAVADREAHPSPPDEV